MNAFVVLEGLNGAGKTTLCKLLAERLEGTYLCFPPLLKEMRAQVEEQNNPFAEFCFYLIGNLVVFHQVKVARRTNIVICDRFVHSTIAAHRMLGVNFDLDLNSLGFEPPDANFFIHVSDDKIRQKRIKGKGSKNKWDLLEENDTLRAGFIAYFRQQNFFFVDTSYETPAQSLSRIVIELHNKGLVRA